MLPSSTKLTIFQRGIAQKCVVFCTYVITISVTAFILDWLDKKTFLNIIHEANKQGSISEQAVNAFTILINARDEKFFLDLIFIGTFCGIKQAMQHIGIHTPEDRIDFVRKQGIPIFIASKPFLEMEQYSIPVRHTLRLPHP